MSFVVAFIMKPGDVTLLVDDVVPIVMFGAVVSIIRFLLVSVIWFPSVSFTVALYVYVPSVRSFIVVSVMFICFVSIRFSANTVLVNVVLFSSPVALCSSNVVYPPLTCADAGLFIDVSFVVTFIDTYLNVEFDPVVSVDPWYVMFGAVVSIIINLSAL